MTLWEYVKFTCFSVAHEGMTTAWHFVAVNDFTPRGTKALSPALLGLYINRRCPAPQYFILHFDIQLRRNNTLLSLRLHIESTLSPHLLYDEPLTRLARTRVGFWSPNTSFWMERLLILYPAEALVILPIGLSELAWKL